MKRLFDSLRRMWSSLRNIFSTLIGRATKGTGIVVQTIGGMMGAGIAFLVLICLLLIITIAAIPYGAFAAATEPIKTSSDVACNKCGVLNVPFFKEGDTILCGGCLRESRAPDPPNTYSAAQTPQG